MRPKLLILSIFTLVVLSRLTVGDVVDCPPGCSPGRWSSGAADLSSKHVKFPDENRDIRVYSPNRRSAFRVQNQYWWVEVEGVKISPGNDDSEIYYPAEISWAPDDRTFYITKSFGYTTGYNTKVFRIDQGHINSLVDVDQIAREAFSAHRCKDQDANFAGFAWKDDSDRLVVVAEVPNVGICDEMVYFGGFEISLSTGRILARYSPNQLAARWPKLLGEELKSDLHYLSRKEKSTVP